MTSEAQIRTWLVEQALPLWLTRGRDVETGAFFEALDFDGSPRTQDIRRVRVQFRQIYVAAHAYQLGLAPYALDVARQAAQAVRRSAWGGDAPGWAHLQAPDGAVIDPGRDTYDHAFALLAFGWLSRVSDDAVAQNGLRDTLAFFDKSLHAENGGWLENDRGADMRRQNPHMHGFEAMLALYEATGDANYLARAEALLTLFKTHFYDSAGAVVREYFDMEWRPWSAEQGQRVEPGHLVEWVWLLREYERLTGASVDEIANPLYERALACGLDTDRRFMIDELASDGAVTGASRRLWPQTELIRASFAQHRATGSPAALAQAEHTLDGLFEEYLSGCIAGGWRDKFSLEGDLRADRMPASSLYHIFGALIVAMEAFAKTGSLAPSRVAQGHAASA
ncbi:MAG: AGE family epimerase/isomerase [Rhodobacteraceae bacterium]|nr:AGE family epimerase/isomerase [Paracoccaceae bacterium]